MADVQIAVRFRRKTGDDALVLAAGKVAIDDRADESWKRVRRMSGALLLIFVQKVSANEGVEFYPKTASCHAVAQTV